MTFVREWFSKRRANSVQRGGMIVETAVAILVFSIVGTVVLTGVSVGARSSTQIGVQANLENLARNEMEYVLGQAYQDPQDPPVACPLDPALAVPNGYSVDCQVAEYEAGDTNIASITVSVSTDGGATLALETVRAK